jgi:hypothetical protein
MAILALAPWAMQKEIGMNLFVACFALEAKVSTFNPLVYTFTKIPVAAAVTAW